MFSNPKVPSYRGHRGSGSGAAQPREPAAFEGDGVRDETFRLTTVKENHHALLPEEVHVADLRPLLENLRPPPSSPPVSGQNGSLRS